MKVVTETRAELSELRKLAGLKAVQLAEVEAAAAQQAVLLDKLLEAQRLEARQVAFAGTVAGSAAAAVRDAPAAGEPPVKSAEAFARGLPPTAARPRSLNGCNRQWCPDRTLSSMRASR